MISPIVGSFTDPKDLNDAFDDFATQLKSTDDWQARIVALETLQSLTISSSYDIGLFMQHLRSCHNLVRSL